MRIVRHILKSTIGNIQWQPPGWCGVIARHRRTSVLIALGILACGFGLREAWQWWQHRPKPVMALGGVSVPSLTTPGFPPHRLGLCFDRSVAPLGQIGKLSPPGVHMTPDIPGRWIWENDFTLCFTPANDWPADTAFRITFDCDAVPSNVRLASHTWDWRTPKFEGLIRNLEFYQDPKDPSIRQVVATLDFTYPVDPDSLKKLAQFSMIGQPGKAPSFEVHVDKYYRTAWMRTESLALPEREDFMKLVLPPGIRTLRGEAATLKQADEKVRIPDIYSFFRIENASTDIVLNDKGDPGQILFVHTTSAAKSDAIAKALTIALLPKKKPSDSDADPQWQSPREIDGAAMQASVPVKFTVIPSRDPVTTEHAFRFSVPQQGQLYIRIGKGVEALGGFFLGSDFDTVLSVPKPRQSVEFEGSGGVLALNGEKKLAVKTRGVPVVEYRISRVRADEINHLVSQTEGEFQRPEFRNYCFSEENISSIATERQTMADANPFDPDYTAFDFAPHLAAAGGDERGLFFLQARGWDPVGKKYIDGADDRRFILVTDLGIIAKANADTSRDIFIASIKNGTPLAGVQVDLLGKNGLPVASGKTDAQGHMIIPPVDGFDREKKPVAFVATLGDDVAFLPFDRDDRILDYSRFDTGGIASTSGADLQAFLFTERGVYRPGDTIHAGYIVKRHDWQGPITGIPVELEILDPAGRAVLIKRTAVPAMGFGELDWTSGIASPTGDYSINLYLVKDDKRTTLLGGTDAWVKEFLPDRMKISSRLTGSDTPGWISPDAARAEISLQNLYGTPAANHRIKSHMVLSPTGFNFAKYPDYSFYDRLLSDDHKPKDWDIDLGEQQTDEKGAATVDLRLERFCDATYSLSFYTEGFEAGSGRSVHAGNTTLVSPLPYVVGYKPDGDLGYISMDAPRSVNFIAVNGRLEKVPLAGLRFRLTQRQWVSVLTKQESGNYAYESIERDSEVSAQTLDLPQAGLNLPLATSQTGDFVLDLLDPSGTKLCSVAYTVVGQGDANRSLEKNAELQIKLPRREFQAGEDVEVAITAPYAGSGLITLERDKVYAQAWFQASTASSVQRIRIPADFEGTGYINVTFFRALDSREIYTSPLSFAVAPVTVNREERRLAIQLDAPAAAKPGEPLHIRYKTDRPSRIVIYAVDQGILQVSDYQLPDPLASFFQQVALTVGTSQILDLILPEYSILRTVSKTGGDGEDLLKKELNPFRRVTEKPVVFWSGIIDADQNWHDVVYDVPDYFDGTLKIMAVGEAADATGSVQRDALIRGRFVITPGMPTFVAPGDMFDVGVTVDNGGDAADVELAADPSESLEIIKAPPHTLHLDHGKDATVIFTMRAKDRLGPASVTFRASAGGEESARRSTTSVRPAVPYLTEVKSAQFKSRYEMPVTRLMYPEFRKLKATVSVLPLGLAGGLDVYLKNYPYGCSEQITSGAFCRLMLAGEADFGLSQKEISAQMEYVFGVLRSRQSDQGGFGFWDASAREGFDFLSVYVTHFLIEAKAAGFAPPPDILDPALRNLRRIAELQAASLDDARIQAYAIYVLTREEVVTTNYIANLLDTLDRNFAREWRTDLTAAYLAGAEAMLKQDDAASSLIKGYSMREATWHGWCYSKLGMNAQYVAILARHFPDLLRRMSPEDFQTVLDPIESGDYDTLSAAQAVLALKSYSELLGKTDPLMSMEDVQANGRAVPLMATGMLTKEAPFGTDTKAIRFAAQPGPFGAFCQVVECGFDRKPSALPVAAGLEIYRKLPATARVGETITVCIQIRSLNQKDLDNIAVVDLLPGGFEVANSSLQPGAGTMSGWDNVDVREDRNVFFGSTGPFAHQIVYQIKPTNSGVFTVPAPFAESMYDRGIHACGTAQTITVEASK